MLDAAHEAQSFVQGRSRDDLNSDRMLLLSLVKSIEIIGEAAGRVTPQGQAQHQTIPWLDIIGMRNRLIHAYFDVDLDRVWDTISDDLPPLISALERSLSDENC